MAGDKRYADRMRGHAGNLERGFLAEEYMAISAGISRFPGKTGEIDFRK
jgi:hypothetical protein